MGNAKNTIRHGVNRVQGYNFRRDRKQIGKAIRNGL